MRVALYARYSDDKQNPGSIADQLAICTRHAQARGWTIVATFTDAAISAAHTANRPGVNMLMAAAEERAFDLVLVEHQDRLFRNLADNARAFERLSYLGIGIATLRTDRVQLMDVAIEGLMSQLYLENLSQKTKRGMHSNAEKGLATGARIYGYRSSPGGEMTILEDEAAVVRRIFQGYAQGLTGVEIAGVLNEDKIPAPGGGSWGATSVIGSRQRGNGILRCELYIGVKVWNRFDLKKDPATGKRVQTIRPESEWKRVDVPHLRIVDQADWEAVQARFAVSGVNRKPQLANAHKPGLFSGLLKCAECGGNYTIKGKGRLVCSTYVGKGAGSCGNRRSILRAELEERVLEGLRTKLLSPAAVAAYVRAYHAEYEAAAAASRARVAPLEKRLAELNRGITRLVDAICDGTETPAMRARLVAAEAEKADIEAQLQAAGDKPPMTLHPRAAEHYAEQVRKLQERLAELKDGRPSADDRKIIDLVRGLVDQIEINPVDQARGAPIEITLVGRLADFMRPSWEENRNESGFRLVAGGGIEPPTCGL